MGSSLLAVGRLLGIVFSALILNAALLFPLTLRRRTWLASAYFKFILWLCGIQLNCRIPRSEIRAQGKFIIVGNHVSYLDILIVSALRPCVFLAKKEVAGWPVFGWVARAMGCVFVHRESLMGRANALRRCLKQLPQADLALFPEGTTTSAKLPDLKAWAKGHAWLAQRADADAILCLGLVYENQEKNAWTDDTSLLPHLLKTLRRPTLKITVTGAWIPVSQSLKPAELALTTHQHLCLAVSYECP